MSHRALIAIALWLLLCALCGFWFVVTAADAQCAPPCPLSKTGCCSEMFRPAQPTDQNLFAQGCYTGNGQDDRKIVTGITNPGFLMVANKNPNGVPGGADVAVWRIPQAVGDDSCVFLNDGDTCRTNWIQQQNTVGYFEVGNTGETNENSQQYCWYQWSLGANHVTFTYTGDGTGNRTVNIGMANPSFALVKSTANLSGSTYAKASLMPADVSYAWNDHLTSEAAPTTRIRNLVSGGIEVGSAFNATGVVYWGAAWKEGTNYGDVLTWTGNGTSGTGGTCATTADVQTVSAACTTRNVLTTQCTLDNCEGEHCSTQSPGLAVIRGTNIGLSVVGPGNITGDDYYAQSAARDRDAFIGVLTGNTFNVRGAPNGDGSANDLDAKYYGFVTCAVGPDVGVVNPVDWSNAMTAVWHMEETNNATRTNNECVNGVTGGTIACGFAGCDCDVVNNATVLQDTTNKVIGAASAAFVTADNDFLSCALTTCNELNFTGSATSVSWGCFGRTNADSVNMNMLTKAADFSVFRDAASDTGTCRVVLTDTTVKDAIGTTNAFPATNTFHSVICLMNGSSNVLGVLVDMVAGTPATGVTDIRDTSGTNTQFRIGRNSTTVSWTGNIDECFLYPGVLATTDACRIASCGVTGRACSCLAGDQTLYVDLGFNSTLGSNCALPVCNKSGPT